MLWRAGDLMAAMTSEVCLAWFRFTEVALAKGILTGPKTSVNTPIQKHMLHTVTNTHHVSCKTYILSWQKTWGLQSYSTCCCYLSRSSGAPTHSLNVKSSEHTSSSACNSCCVVQLSPVQSQMGDYSLFLFVLFWQKNSSRISNLNFTVLLTVNPFSKRRKVFPVVHWEQVIPFMLIPFIQPTYSPFPTG